MLLLSAMWGFNQVAIKLAAPGISLVMQACLRSTVAAVLLFAYARLRGIPLFDRDGTLPRAWLQVHCSPPNSPSSTPA